MRNTILQIWRYLGFILFGGGYPTFAYYAWPGFDDGGQTADNIGLAVVVMVAFAIGLGLGFCWYREWHARSLL